MRKSKIMKALLVFGMSAVTATSIVGFAACDNGEGGGGGTGGHKHSYDGWLTSATEHWQECVADGEEANRGAHADGNNDGRCDTCNYELNHTYAEAWTSDASGHWHAATCDHTTEKGNFAVHVDDGTTAGSTAGDNVCDVCGYVGAVSDGYKALAEKAGVEVVLSETFFAQDKKLDTAFTSFGTATGLYARPESGSATTATHYLNVTGGSAVHVTDGATNVGLVADFGGNITGKVVEGYIDLSPNATGNDWSVLKFYNGNNCDDANRVFSIHTTESGGTLGYSLNDKGTKYAAKETVVLAANPSTPYRVYYKFDLTTGRVTATVNDKVICEDLNIGATSLSGYEVISSNKGQRLVTVDNLITVTRAGTFEEYKASALLSLDETEAKLPESLQDSEAYKTAKSAIEAAETNEACDTAYNTYYSAVIGSYKTYVNGIVDNNYAGKYTTAGKNKEAYDAAASALTTALNGSNLDNAIAAYNTFVATVAELHDNDYYQQADATVTVTDGTNSASITGLKVGDKITKQQVSAAFAQYVETGYFISDYKIGETSIDFGTDGYTVTSESLSITVVIAQLKQVEYHETAAYDKLTADKELIADTLWATSGVSADANSKTAGDVSVDYRLKTNGTFKYNSGAPTGALKLVLTAGAKVTVYSISGNSSGGRDLVLYDSTGTATTQKFTPDGSTMTEYTYNVEAGTWYIGSASSGINIYRIVIDYSA